MKNYLSGFSPSRLKRFRKLNILKSALYSARIEGNPLTFENVKTTLLSPRQEKIYYIVKNCKITTLSFISSKLPKIPERTLRYDLKTLADYQFIIKIGKTRGSFYKSLN